jgi:hypothetical protein
MFRGLRSVNVQECALLTQPPPLAQIVPKPSLQRGSKWLVSRDQQERGSMFENI